MLFRVAAVALVLVATSVASVPAQDLGPLSGRVSDPYGVPVAGVDVRVVSVSGYVEAVRSDGAGRFRFPALVTGLYEITFLRDGYLGQDRTVVVSAEIPAVVVVELEPAVPAVLSGAVVDEQGLALPGATVELRRGSAPAVVLVTDAAGRFRVSPARPGDWSVAASLPGFFSASDGATVAFGETTTVTLVLALDFGLAEEVVVVGSRQAEPRTVADSAVPVDVLQAADFESQPRADMAELLRALAPSFNVNTQPISDAATIIRPVNLRNLPPDHLLVLVNGKRRHRGAVIAWLGNGLSDGAQGPDLSAIPSIAVRQAELLRDGAAAQYGSDAISGVLNFQLKDARDGGSVVVSTGSYLTPNTGDPAACAATVAPGGYSHSCDAIGGRAGAYSFAGNVGLPIGASGFGNLSLEYGESDPTNRALQRADAGELRALGNTAVRDTAQVWGLPRVSGDLKAFGNFGFDAGLYRPYAQVNYARREVLGGFYYRHPHSRGGVFRGPVVGGLPTLLVGDRLAAGTGGAESAGCPTVPVVDGRPDPDALAAVEAHPDCFTLYSRFPGGFTPQFGGTLFDMSAVTGVRYLRPDGFGWDVSAGVGRSRVDQVLSSTVNASLGLDTPTSFRPGTAEQTDADVNFDLTVPLRAGFHLTTGAEWRQEAFALGAGDRASWAIGPYAAQGFSSGSNGFNGYRPDTAAGRWGRANVAFYGDLEHRDSEGRWTLGGAARGARFEDFGTTLNGKLAARVGLPGSVSLRGAVSTGFRAPTPGQQNAFNVTTAFIGGELVNRGVVPPTSGVAMARGGGQLQPERSVHYSLGMVRSGRRMHFAVDAFLVEVSDRLSLSREISLTAPEVDLLLAEGIPEARNFPVFRFFVNDFATRTYGFDATWQWDVGAGTVGAALNRTVTELHSLAGTVIDAYRVATLERGLPETRWQLWARPEIGAWRFLARYNWYGSYWDAEDGRNAQGLGVVVDPWLYPAYPGRGLLDVEATRDLGSDLSLSVGATNVLSAWPAENPYAAYTVGNRYGQFSPFGFEGAYVYARINYGWGS